MNTSHSAFPPRPSETVVPPALPVAGGPFSRGNRLVQWFAITVAAVFSLALFSVANALMKSGHGRDLLERTALADTGARQRVATSQYETAQSEAAALRRELIAAEGEKERFEASVKAYLLDHKMAVAAIVAGLGGSTVALDDTNNFSSDARAIAGTAAFLGVLWAIANHEEVIDVADRMARASAMMEDFTGRISKLKRRIAEAESRAAVAKNAL